LFLLLRGRVFEHPSVCDETLTLIVPVYVTYDVSQRSVALLGGYFSLGALPTRASFRQMTSVVAGSTSATSIRGSDHVVAVRVRLKTRPSPENFNAALMSNTSCSPHHD